MVALDPALAWLGWLDMAPLAKTCAGGDTARGNTASQSGRPAMDRGHHDSISGGTLNQNEAVVAIVVACCLTKVFIEALRLMGQDSVQQSGRESVKSYEDDEL